MFDQFVYDGRTLKWFINEQVLNAHQSYAIGYLLLYVEDRSCTVGGSYSSYEA